MTLKLHHAEDGFERRWTKYFNKNKSHIKWRLKSLAQILQSNDIWWVPYNIAEHHHCTSYLQNSTMNAIFFPLKTKWTKSIYFIQLHFFPDIDEGETEILQIALHSKLGSSGEKRLNTWLSLFLFSKIIKIVFNLKYFAEYSVLLNQGFHKCKLFNSTNCKPPDFFRLIWTESELKAFQVLPITIS